MRFSALSFWIDLIKSACKQNKNKTLYDLGQRTPFPPYQFIQMGLGNVSPTQETPSELSTAHTFTFSTGITTQGQHCALQEVI